jgi:SH3-like domain-containing protein
LTFAVPWVKPIRMRKILMIPICVSLALPVAAARGEKPLPYWASIKTGEARMRTGPGRQFPASWLYRRAGLPVKVIELYPNWRKITDPDGTTGWIQSNLITDTRTAIIMGGIQDLHAAAAEDAPIVWRAEPGVVGMISQCRSGWCLFDVKGRSGYIQTAYLWGTAADEQLP